MAKISQQRAMSADLRDQIDDLELRVTDLEDAVSELRHSALSAKPATPTKATAAKPGPAKTN